MGHFMGYFMLYGSEKNMQISWACGNYTPYFRHITENQFKNFTDFGIRTPDMQKCLLISYSEECNHGPITVDVAIIIGCDRSAL